jgi:phage baseplate assembly protein W
MAADESFLGQGWNFALGQNAGLGLVSGQIAEASGDEKIRQSIWLILSTAPGERVGRPDFGSGIHDLVFAPRTATTLGEVSRAVTAALRRWEPRIEVLGVTALPHPRDVNGIVVELQYEVRATNSRFNLVYPFYLSP